MPAPEDLLPAEPPLLPLPRGLLKGRVVRVVTVPRPGCWNCSNCEKHLDAGVQVVKIGKIILCDECIRKK